MAKKHKSNRPKIGDIIEIPLSEGFAYVQYTHYHKAPPVYGPLFRLLPGKYENRPSDCSKLVKLKELYYFFCLLDDAVVDGDAFFVCSEEVPERCKPFPLFKSGHIDPSTKKISNWWLWDGEKSWRIGTLPKEHYDLSMKIILTIESVKKRIEAGWMPTDEAT